MQLIVISNRRDTYLEQALCSIVEFVSGVTDVTVIDDSGDHDFRQRLSKTYRCVAVGKTPVGYRGAVAKAFSIARGSHFMLWEEDFVAVSDVNVRDMARCLDARPHLAQLALMRQPWYEPELRAGA